MKARTMAAYARNREETDAGTAQGLAASFAALGLCRFGYGLALPLLAAAMPAQQQALHVLVAVHLAGYLSWTLRSGFIGGHAPRDTSGFSLRLACCALTLAATAASTHIGWIGLCRFLSGYASAALLAASPVMRVRLPTGAKHRTGEAITYMGGGLGLLATALVSTAMTASLDASAAAAGYWLLLAAASVVAAAPGILQRSGRTTDGTHLQAAWPGPAAASAVPRRLTLAIGLFGCVLATPTMWWAHGLMLLGRPELAAGGTAALLTALVGTGALAGPWLARRMMRVWSGPATAMLLLSGMAAGFLLPLLSLSFPPSLVPLSLLTLAAAAWLCGLALTGVTIALRQTCERCCPAPHAAWRQLTRLSAAAQVASAVAAAALPPPSLGYVLFAASAALAAGAAAAAGGIGR